MNKLLSFPQTNQDFLSTKSYLTDARSYAKLDHSCWAIYYNESTYLIFVNVYSCFFLLDVSVMYPNAALKPVLPVYE